MIRVLIADPHTVLRHGLRLILQEDSTLMVVGEAGTGADAVSETMRLRPDVVLMGLRMPDFCGIKAIEQIRSATPESKVLVLTVADQSEDMLAACKAGARGYLLKTVNGSDVIQAIHQVAAGQAALPPSLTTRLLDELSAPPSPCPEMLTVRELDVLHYIVQGFGNKEIASTLNISENTVKTHVRRILTKLNLRNRTEVATYALQTNMLA